MRTPFRAAAVPLLSALSMTAALATPVNSVPIDVTTSVIDFSAYDAFTSPRLADGVNVGTDSGFESVLLNFSQPGDQHILGSVSMSLGFGGSWPQDGAYAGLNAATGSMSFTFERGLSFLGGFISFDPASESVGSPVTVTAFGLGGVELESVELNFTDVNNFLGFSRDAADIYGLTLSNGKIVIDDLTFTSAAVNGAPEPATLALVLASLGLLGATRRRQA